MYASAGLTPRISERSLVAFDYDGTIGDTLPAIVSTAREVLLGFGLSEEELGDLTRLVGPPFPQAYTLVYGMSEEDAAEVTRRYRAIYGNLGPAAWPAFPGLAELLGDLRMAGKTLAVVSSKRTPLLVHCLTDDGLEQNFARIAGKDADDGSVSKADTLARVMDELGFGPDDTVMVGDRHYDIEAAREQGVASVGVYLGGTAPEGELEDAGADAIARSVDELRKVLLG